MMENNFKKLAGCLGARLSSRSVSVRASVLSTIVAMMQDKSFRAEWKARIKSFLDALRSALSGSHEEQASLIPLLLAALLNMCCEKEAVKPILRIESNFSDTEGAPVLLVILISRTESEMLGLSVLRRAVMLLAECAARESEKDLKHDNGVMVHQLLIRHSTFFPRLRDILATEIQVGAEASQAAEQWERERREDLAIELSEVNSIRRRKGEGMLLCSTMRLLAVLVKQEKMAETIREARLLPLLAQLARRSDLSNELVRCVTLCISQLADKDALCLSELADCSPLIAPLLVLAHQRDGDTQHSVTLALNVLARDAKCEEELSRLPYGEKILQSALHRLCHSKGLDPSTVLVSKGKVVADAKPDESDGFVQKVKSVGVEETEDLELVD